MGFLGGLQADTGLAAQQSWVEGDDLRGHNLLRQMRDHEEVKRAPELDRGTIDALAEVFDFVFADPGAVRYSMTITYFVLLPGSWLLLWFARPAYLSEVRRLKEAAA